MASAKDQEEPHRRSWHIGKEIPVAVIIGMVAQTAGIVWWAASISAKVDSMKETALAQVVMQTSVDRRQDDENRRTEERITVELAKVNAKLDRLIEIRMSGVVRRKE